MEILYTLEQAATICGVSYQYIRDCYADGVLPEPKHVTIFKRKRARKFTKAEVDKLKGIFADKDPNKFKDKRRRARISRQIKEGAKK